MQITMSSQEKDLLLELLESAYTATLHELHHTDSHDFKDMLKQKIGLIESLSRQLKSRGA